jgi:hypothetical protein
MSKALPIAWRFLQIAGSEYKQLLLMAAACVDAEDAGGGRGVGLAAENGLVAVDLRPRFSVCRANCRYQARRWPGDGERLLHTPRVLLVA